MSADVFLVAHGSAFRDDDGVAVAKNPGLAAVDLADRFRQVVGGHVIFAGFDGHAVKFAAAPIQDHCHLHFRSLPLEARGAA